MGELHPICTKCIKQIDFQKSVKLILPQPFFLLQYLNLETLWFAPYHHEFCCIFLRYHLLNIHFRIYNIEVRKKYKNILKLYGSAFDIKNGKLINCYQSYLSYYLLIFLIYHNNLLQMEHFLLDLIPCYKKKWTEYGKCYYMAINQFLWSPHDAYWLKERIYTLQSTKW